ncbi:MAG: alpha-L-fucosidase, partial [Lentisphaerota bacterium]
MRSAFMDVKMKNWLDLRFGMFIHFGLYSMLGGMWQGRKITDGYSEQIRSHGKITKEEYEQLAKQFNPIHFNPDSIAELAVDTGMKYIVITAKHHDGFSMFHTKHSEFNIVDATPYGKDIVLQMSEACQRHGLKLGIYFSWIDWHYPYAAPMSKHNSDPIPDEHMEFNLYQVEELLTNYGPIAEIWFDMGAPTAEQSRKMAELVHHLQPNALINGRIWNDQGDFAVLGDNQIPEFAIAGPWQTPASIYHATWGYRSWQVRDDLEGKIAEQTSNLGKVLGLGGNYLLNIGPRGDGSVVDFEKETLLGIGKWASENQNVFSVEHAEELQRSGQSVHVLGKERPCVLRDEDAKDLHHYTGKDYYSSKAVITEKRWLYQATSGNYEIFIEAKEIQNDRQTVIVSTAGETFTVDITSGENRVPAGLLKLKDGGTYEMSLSLFRGPDFAKHSVNLTVLDVIM